MFVCIYFNGQKHIYIRYYTLSQWKLYQNSTKHGTSITLSHIQMYLHGRFWGFDANSALEIWPRGHLLCSNFKILYGEIILFFCMSANGNRGERRMWVQLFRDDTKCEESVPIPIRVRQKDAILESPVRTQFTRFLYLIFVRHPIHSTLSSRRVENARLLKSHWKSYI